MTDSYEKIFALDDLSGNIIWVKECDLKELCGIKHAYALTIHKFQVGKSSYSYTDFQTKNFFSLKRVPRPSVLSLASQTVAMRPGGSFTPRSLAPVTEW